MGVRLISAAVQPCGWPPRPRRAAPGDPLPALPAATAAALAAALACVEVVGAEADADAAEAARADYRITLLASCAAQVEAYAGRLWWPRPVASTPARRAVSEIEITADDGGPLRAAWMPAHPATSPLAAATPDGWSAAGWTLPQWSGSLTMAGPVERWTGSAWAAVEPAPAVLPGGEWEAPQAGIYRAAATWPGEGASSTPDPPAAAVEALHRLWGWLDSRRPTWSRGEQQPPALSGALLKSGAQEALAPLAAGPRL